MASRNTKFCAHCGKEIQEDADPCPFCGRPTSPKILFRVGSLVTPPLHKLYIKIPVRFLIVVIAVFIIGVAVGVLLTLSFR